MVQLLGFSLGTLPFIYLGAPIFRGRPKKIYFQPIADRVKIKLASWKASLLSIAGRVQLVKSVIQSMLIHTMTIFSWPISLLREMEKWIKNFIWSGDINKRKLVTVAWKKVCADIEEGGLGIRSLICLNNATNLKQCWELFNSEEQWADVLRSRVIRRNNCIQHHIYSSIWSGIKKEFNIVKENTYWNIGDGKGINFLMDQWCGDPLIQTLNLTSAQIQNFPQMLCEYVQNGQWYFPADVVQEVPLARSLVSHVTIPIQRSMDKLVWKHSGNGYLSLKDAYNFKKNHFPKLPWAKIIWSSDIPPSKSLCVWRVMLNKLSTDDNLKNKGYYLPSMCTLCKKHEESIFHLFFECSYAVNLWNWLAAAINKRLIFQTVEDIWSVCNMSWNPQCKLVITTSLINIINSIWYARNQERFSMKRIPWRSSLSNVIASTCLSGNLSKIVAAASINNFVILKKFNVSLHPPKAPKIIEVIWKPPLPLWIKCNTDGSSNAITSACGGIFRDHHSNFLLCFAENTGHNNAFNAELLGAMRAIEFAKQYGWNNLWLECDSSLVINAIQNKSLVPWRLRNRWSNCMLTVNSMNFLATHVFREGNTCADTLANVGLSLSHLTVWMNTPDCIREFYVKNKLGMSNYRFVGY